MKILLFYTKKKAKARAPAEPENLSYVQYCRSRGIDPDPEDYDTLHDYMRWVFKVQELGER